MPGAGKERENRRTCANSEAAACAGAAGAAATAATDASPPIALVARTETATSSVRDEALTATVAVRRAGTARRAPRAAAATRAVWEAKRAYVMTLVLSARARSRARATRSRLERRLGYFL